MCWFSEMLHCPVLKLLGSSLESANMPVPTAETIYASPSITPRTYFGLHNWSGWFWGSMCGNEAKLCYTPVSSNRKVGCRKSVSWLRSFSYLDESARAVPSPTVLLRGSLCYSTVLVFPSVPEPVWYKPSADVPRKLSLSHRDAFQCLVGEFLVSPSGVGYSHYC